MSFGLKIGAAAACLLALGACALASPTLSGAHSTTDPPSAAEFREETRDLMSTPSYSLPSAFRGGGLDPGGDTVRSDGLFPSKQLLTLYGAPQLAATILGKLAPKAAARKVVKQTMSYARISDRQVIPGFDLIAVVANSTAGSDGLYRTRQPDKLIGSYLRASRSVGGRLVLDIQPGRAKVKDEIDALEDWIAEPDVDVSIDPEWNVGPRGVPGRTVGTIKAKELNKISRRVQEIVDANDLPTKALVVHQFHPRSVRHREDIKQRKGVDVTLSFDGIGSSEAKRAGYERLTSDAAFSGFSIFYSLDTRIMSPRSVLGLRPGVDFLLFQ